MKKGDQARENVKTAIIEAFGESFICVQDKKIYVNSAEGNEIFQFAISITMPKNTVALAPTNNKEPDKTIFLSEEDNKKVFELKKKLKESGFYYQE